MLNEFRSLSSRMAEGERFRPWRDNDFFYVSEYIWVLRYPVRFGGETLPWREKGNRPDPSFLPWEKAEDGPENFYRVSAGDLLPYIKPCDACNGKSKRFFKVCEECAGDCVLTFSSDINEYEVECRSCRGEGHTELSEAHSGQEKVFTEPCCKCEGFGFVDSMDKHNGEAAYSPARLLSIIDTTGPVWMKPAGHRREPIYFKFGLNGDGFIMPRVYR